MLIVFLGDSLTWGGYGGNFVAGVAAQLPEHEVINAGIGGNTVLNLYRRLDTITAQMPDIIFTMIGGNDVISYTYPEVRPYYQQVQEIPDGFISPQQFERIYRDLLTEIQLQQILPLVGLPPTEANAKVIEGMRHYNKIARKVAEQLNVPVLDLFAHFPPSDIGEGKPISLQSINEIGRRVIQGWADYEAERQQYGYTFTFDGLHLMPQAAMQVANLIVKFLAPYL